jgi:uncharacterized membrane protein YpjA
MSDDAHGRAGHESHIPGVTHDPILRPVGIVLVIVGGLWALFVPVAMRAGTLDLPKAAVLLIVVGLVMAAVGKAEQQI